MGCFEQFQELWQNQPGPRAGEDPAELVRRVQAYSLRQLRIAGVKLAVVAAVLAWSLAYGPNGWFRAGVACIAAGAALMLLADWRGHRLDFGAPSRRFVRDGIRKLAARRGPARERYWIFLAAMLTGANLMFHGAIQARTELNRLLVHLSGTIICAAAFHTGIGIRRRRFETKCRPLLDRLVALEPSLEDPRP